MKEYTMSEKAFVDVWNEFDRPDEINDENESQRFLNRLQEVTEGLYIVDHISGTNYDYVERIEIIHNYFKIIWKDLSNEKDELLRMVFGDADYIYSFCKINKIKFVYSKGHLFILIVPIVASDKEVMKVLGISKLPKNMFKIDENFKELTSEIMFIKDEEFHRCISHKMPFYSFLFQPKEHNRNTGVSTKLLLLLTMNEIKERIERVTSKLKNVSHHDDLSELGNTLRRILEHMLKYYMCYKGIDFPKESYGNNMLGELSNAIIYKDDEKDLGEMLDSELKIIANELSHDSGKVFSKEDIKKFLDKVNKIRRQISELTIG